MEPDDINQDSSSQEVAFNEVHNNNLVVCNSSWSTNSQYFKYMLRDLIDSLPYNAIK